MKKNFIKKIIAFLVLFFITVASALLNFGNCEKLSQHLKRIHFLLSVEQISILISSLLVQVTKTRRN